MSNNDLALLEMLTDLSRVFTLLARDFVALCLVAFVLYTIAQACLQFVLFARRNLP